MTEDEKQILKTWILNTGIRFENDLIEARNDFQHNENAWLAFRLALSGERKNTFDTMSAQLFALLKL